MGVEQAMVISVMAKDRPGIVADVTGAISRLGGNLADLRESVLCGYFTMILIAGFPEKVSPARVELEISEASDSNVAVTPYAGDDGCTTEAANIYVLTAIAQNRIGLVAQVSGFCCANNINILDMASHVEGDQYTMMLQIDLSCIADLEQFNEKLAVFGTSSSLNLELQHNDIFRATNEI